MHVLVVLLLGLVLLYFWLLGHWFARVVAFLVLGFGGWFLFALLYNSAHDIHDVGIILGVEPVIALALAWIVASIPTYARRAR